MRWKSLCLVSILLDVNNCSLVNLAVNKSATQSSTYSVHEASKAIDGIDGLLPLGYSCSHTAGWSANPAESSPWWEVDMLQDFFIFSVAITHIARSAPRLAHDFSIEIYKDGESIGDAELCYYHVGDGTSGRTVLYMCKQIIKGRYVRITINGQPDVYEMLILCEVRVFGTQLASIASSYLRFEDVQISNTPDMNYSIQGYGQCAMKCYVLPMCHIFSVKFMSTYYQCNIYANENIYLVGNSTGSPHTVVFFNVQF